MINRRGPGRGTFKTAFATSALPSSSRALLFAGEPEAAIRCAVELGYDGVDLSIRDPTDGAARKHAEAFVASGISIATISTGLYFVDGHVTLVESGLSGRREFTDRVQHVVQYAAAFDSLVTIGAVRGRLSGTDHERGSQYDQALEGLAVFANEAERNGVDLIIEPLNRYEGNYLSTIDEALEAIKRIGAANIGLLADTFHMNIEEGSMAEAIRAAGPRLRHVHLSDSNRQPPGDGHIDFEPVIDVLREQRYSGYVSAEVVGVPDSWSAAERSISYFRLL